MPLSITRWRRETLNSLMTQFIADVKAGKYRQGGWPGINYGMSKLGVIAYSNVRDRNQTDRKICIAVVQTEYLGQDTATTPTIQQSHQRSVLFRCDSGRWLAFIHHPSFRRTAGHKLHHPTYQCTAASSVSSRTENPTRWLHGRMETSVLEGCVPAKFVLRDLGKPLSPVHQTI